MAPSRILPRNLIIAAESLALPSSLLSARANDNSEIIIPPLGIALRRARLGEKTKCVCESDEVEEGEIVRDSAFLH